jgi:hypothetical protein
MRKHQAAAAIILLAHIISITRIQSVHFILPADVSMLMMCDQVPLTQIRPLTSGLSALEYAAQSCAFHSQHLIPTFGARAADFLSTVQAEDVFAGNLQPDGKVMIIIKG